jgi:hypothetical protein
MKCNYRNCGEAIPPDENGNRRYCNDDCYMAEKLERSKDNYAVNKKNLNQIKHVENILNAAYKKYGGDIFDVNILRVEKMNWTVITGTTTIDGETIRIVGRYGYILYSNKTIKIIKL